MQITGENVRWGKVSGGECHTPVRNMASGRCPIIKPPPEMSPPEIWYWYKVSPGGI